MLEQNSTRNLPQKHLKKSLIVFIDELIVITRCWEGESLSTGICKCLASCLFLSHLKMLLLMGESLPKKETYWFVLDFFVLVVTTKRLYPFP